MVQRTLQQLLSKLFLIILMKDFPYLCLLNSSFHQFIHLNKCSNTNILHTNHKKNETSTVYNTLLICYNLNL